MAWNEPGGSGNKDPWGGNKNNEQGPPDLDEVVKKLQQKFGALFGGGGPRKPGSAGGGKAGSIGFGLIAAVAIAVWAISGVYIVEEGTRGVVLQFGKYNKTTQPGPHWYPRGIQSVETVDIENIRGISIGFRATGVGRQGQGSSSVGRESLMLTQDENIVDVKLAVQYKVSNASDYIFNVKDPETSLRQAIESAIRETVGKSNMDFILKEGRADVTAQTRETVQSIMDLYKTGLQVTTVNLQDAQPPEQVQDAFADAVKAQGDQARVINEAEAYSNDIIPRARGKAARLLAEANAYKEQVIAEATGEASRFTQVLAEYRKAPKVTRKRLYLEAVESVMSNSSKVMVDVKGGGNLLYLPLDKMMSGGSTASSSDARRIVEGASTPEPTVEQRLRDTVRSRRGVR